MKLKTNGVLVLDIDGNKVELTEEDLLIETAQTEGYVTETEGETAVVHQIPTLTPELIEEDLSGCRDRVVKYRPCVKRLALRLWIRSAFL